ncbi:unnamed protein product, partial [Musa hybrid cultivar]
SLLSFSFWFPLLSFPCVTLPLFFASRCIFGAGGSLDIIIFREIFLALDQNVGPTM